MPADSCSTTMEAHSEAPPAKHENELLAVLRRDPRETNLLIRAGLAIPLAIILCRSAPRSS